MEKVKICKKGKEGSKLLKEIKVKKMKNRFYNKKMKK